MNLTDHRIQQIIDENGGNFTVREFGSDRQHLNPELIRQAVLFRAWHGFSSLITSAYRNSGSHSLGAIDKVLYSKWKSEQPEPMHLWRIATTWPWMGVGIYFDWDQDETNDIDEPIIGLHMDIVQPDQRDRPLRWLRADGIYYYQSLINGRFYSPDGGSETTLAEEIEIWKKRKESDE